MYAWPVWVCIQKSRSEMFMSSSGSRLQSQSQPEARLRSELPLERETSLTQMALWVQALLCGTLALFLYYHTLKFHYTLDDLASIQENPDVSLETSFEQLWTNDYWGNSMLSLDTHGSYRPLTIISFRWTYWLVQLYTNTTNLDDTINSNDFVFYLHLGNVLLHGVASMLVVVLSHDLIHSSHWESPFRYISPKPLHIQI